MIKINILALEYMVLWVVTWVLIAAGSNDVHKHMTIEELKHTFHVDQHNLVPEYEVVHIHHLISRSASGTLHSTDPTTKDGTTYRRVSEPELDSKRKRKKFGNKATDHGKYQNVDKTKIRLKAFGKPLDLTLTKTEGLFKKSGLKIWTVEPNATSQHGVEYVEIPSETHEDIGEIYQDEQNQAALLLRKDETWGHVIVEGSVGPSLVIKPLPVRLHPVQSYPAAQDTTIDGSRHLLPPDDDEMFLDDDGELSAEVAIDTGLPIYRNKTSPKNIKSGKLTDASGEMIHSLVQHIVYRKHDEQDEDNIDYAFMEPDHMSKRFRRSTLQRNGTLKSLRRKKREAPYTIYPEILVIVDYDGYRLHGGDNLQIKRYFVSFWNGVDLRYKLLKGPKIRISIAGIIISRGRDATPYLERNRVGRDAIDSAAALTDMGKYLFRERRLPVYDIAVAITKLDMCRRSYPNDVCNRGTAGFAYVGGACVVNKRLEKVNSVAIIEDTGGFSGIIVAAHEVGHLLGAVHDGSPPPSYLGGTGAEKCQWTDGYIMSDLRHTERGFRWSACSVASFHHFLNGDTATCLYNSPHEDDGLPRVLPGKLLTLDAQCRRDRGTSACFKDDRVCAQLFCFDAGSGYCVAYRPAAEGSPCGDGQYCLNGRCVAEHENIIPDYSQNTPSYIRRDNSNQGRPLFHDEDDDIIDAAPPQYYQPQYYSNPPPNYNTDNPYHTSSSTQQPYYQYPTTKKRYSYTTSTTKQPYYTTHPSTKQYYYTQTTTKNPHDLQTYVYSSSSQRPPNAQAYFSPKNYFASYTTKVNPINSSPTVSTIVSTKTTLNPYIGNYYQIKQRTTRNPYDFANFGKNYQSTKNPYNSSSYNEDINNNYLKRSYNTASYYSDSSNVNQQKTNSTIQNLSRGSAKS